MHLFFLGIILAGSAAGQDPSRWEVTIQELESAEKGDFAREEGILFLGSSSIRLWDLAKYFPDRQTLNRGFGGSHISDSLHYAERIVIPLAPRIIVFYAGDNDIAAGKSPETVFDDYRAFVAKILGNLPNTCIIFISIKPSLSRWRWVEEMRAANLMIQSLSASNPCLEFLDIDRLMIGDDGKPRPDLFAEDGLHLSPAGYELWTAALTPRLDLASEAECCGTNGD